MVFDRRLWTNLSVVCQVSDVQSLFYVYRSKFRLWRHIDALASQWKIEITKKRILSVADADESLYLKDETEADNNQTIWQRGLDYTF